MKNKEKFECGECGCYFWVKDRNNFECPNCETIKVYDETCDECGDIHDQENEVMSIKEVVEEKCICPECGEKIEHFAVKVIKTGVEYSLDGWEEGERDESCIYQCPECFEELAFGEEEAIKLLKGEK